MELEYSIGNRKIGNDTMIINMGPAATCPSRAAGLCAIPAGKCYAAKAERVYLGCLPYRKRQEKYWYNNDGATISADISAALRRHKRIKYIRFNESGDFYSQKDIAKLYFIAEANPDIIVYTYTARRDLDFSLRPKNLAINGSGFMIDNNFMAVPEYSAASDKRGRAWKINSARCAGDCRACNLCKRAGKLVIENLYH